MGADDHSTVRPDELFRKAKKFCTECDRELRVEWSYCPNCGTPAAPTTFDNK